MELHGHSDSVNSVAFSPDGLRIVSGSIDSTVRVWDAQSGAEQLKLHGHIDSVNSVAFSPDGLRIASGSADNTVKVWDARSGAEKLKFQGHSDSVTSVAFSPDGLRIVSGSTDNTVRVWDVLSAAEISTFRQSAYVSSVAFSPDGLRIASGSLDDVITLWDIVSASELSTFYGHSEELLGIAFSPDGLSIASTSLDGIRLWDSRSGSEVLTLQGHFDRVNSVAISPDGTRIASGADDRTVRLWDTRTGAELLTFKGHSGSVDQVAFSPDGMQIQSIVANNHDDVSERFLWDTKTMERRDLDKVPEWAGITRTKHGNLFVTSVQNDVLIIDSSPMKSLEFQQFLEGKSRFDPSWHRNEADQATQNENWHASTFHRAWQLKANPQEAYTHFLLHQAWDKFTASLPDDEKVNSNQLAQGTVRESLKLPRGSVVNKQDAETLNSIVWNRVKFIIAKDTPELELLELAVQQHGESNQISSLGVAYFRIGRFEDAMKVLSRLLPLKTTGDDKSAPNPVDTAFLALSHLKLGNKEEAAQFRAMFDEAMKIDANSKDEDYQSFQREIEEAFAP